MADMDTLIESVLISEVSRFQGLESNGNDCPVY